MRNVTVPSRRMRNALDWRPLAFPLLVNGRGVLAELTKTCRQDEHTIRFHMGSFSNLIAEANYRGVGAGCDNKL